MHHTTQHHAVISASHYTTHSVSASHYTAHCDWRITLYSTLWLTHHTTQHTVIDASHYTAHSDWRITLHSTQWLTHHSTPHTVIDASTHHTVIDAYYAVHSDWHTRSTFLSALEYTILTNVSHTIFQACWKDENNLTLVCFTKAWKQSIPCSYNDL